MLVSKVKVPAKPEVFVFF